MPVFSKPRLGKLLYTLPKRMSHELKFNPSGTMLAVTYVDGGVSIWDPKTGSNFTPPGGSKGALYSRLEPQGRSSGNGWQGGANRHLGFEKISNR